jgi:four helix bundle protein
MNGESSKVTGRPLDHERLDVYRVALEFVSWRGSVLRRVPKHSDIADQLTRAATSVVLNIAEGAGEFSGPERVRFYRMARRSAMECGAVLDLLERMELERAEKVAEGRVLLERVVAMLTVLTRTVTAI